MSGSTISGATIPNNWVPTSGATAAFNQMFAAASAVEVFAATGVSTVTGPVAITSSGGADTLSSSAVADISPGNNQITTVNQSTVFLGANDTVTSAAATTLFGGETGVGHFAISGGDSSVTGGVGGLVGLAAGANSTLVGGSGNSIFTVTGANSLAVAGPGPGVTGVTEAGTSAPEVIATNPLGNSGTLVATLGSGADTVLGGSGASTITGGSGNDVFAFIKGHASGSEVILNFTAKDNLAFAGYGYTGSSLPAEHVGTFDGIASDTITLSDGTSITLVGIDHKLF
jgi:Ca2+-binding RTX toxin-like protein